MSCQGGCGCGPRTQAPRGCGGRGGGCGPSRSSSRSKSTSRTTQKPVSRSKSRGGGCGCGCGPRSRYRSKSRSSRKSNEKRNSSKNSSPLREENVSIAQAEENSRGRCTPIWAKLGPDPDLQEMFKEYDKKYFGGVLTERGVTVEWSKRLKATVGSCSSDTAPKIRISLPLLSIRPKRDLVETLLHEMIHAYVELTDDWEPEEHGPNFHKHVQRIDKLTGTRLTVEHHFHKEVEMNQYKWLCSGKCKKVVRHCHFKPPGPSCAWWEGHSNTCGGTFNLVSSPISLKTSGSPKTSVKRIALANVGNKSV